MDKNDIIREKNKMQFKNELDKLKYEFEIKKVK